MMVKPAADDMVLDVHTLSKKKIVGDILAWCHITEDRQWLR